MDEIINKGEGDIFLGIKTTNSMSRGMTIIEVKILIEVTKGLEVRDDHLVEAEGMKVDKEEDIEL